MQLACGFNNGFLTDLPVPPNVVMMEIGLAAYLKADLAKLDTDRCAPLLYSIHISTSPISECRENQDRYIDSLLNALDPTKVPISLGFHLCGPRDENIGKYGLSPHYSVSAEKESNAIRFIKKIKQRTGIEVWIENANFYSSSPSEIITSIQSMERIADRAGCQTIVDLSHLIIDCKNNDVDPNLFAGLINWSKAKEIHISGIKEGRDTTLHDCHSERVHDKCWELLNILNRSELINSVTYLNLEHTEDSWRLKPADFLDDFIKAVDQFETPYRTSLASKHKEQYAISYLRRIITEKVKNLHALALQRQISIPELLNGWEHFMKEQGDLIALRPGDQNEHSVPKRIFILESFTQYISRH